MVKLLKYLFIALSKSKITWTIFCAHFNMAIIKITLPNLNSLITQHFCLMYTKYLDKWYTGIFKYYLNEFREILCQAILNFLTILIQHFLINVELLIHIARTNLTLNFSTIFEEIYALNPRISPKLKYCSCFLFGVQRIITLSDSS